MRRGDVYGCDGQLFVLITPTSGMEILTTAWGLLVTDTDPGTPPPLAVHVPKCLTSGDATGRDAWVRMLQIRTVAIGGLDPTLRGHIAGDPMVAIDRMLSRLAGVD